MFDIWYRHNGGWRMGSPGGGGRRSEDRGSMPGNDRGAPARWMLMLLLCLVAMIFILAGAG